MAPLDQRGPPYLAGESPLSPAGGFCITTQKSMMEIGDTLFGMSEIEIVQSSFHSNGRAAPFYAAIVDDPDAGDTKIVIMFDEPDYTAVLSLDVLLDTEDVTAKLHDSRGDRYDDLLRDALWYPEGIDE